MTMKLTLNDQVMQNSVAGQMIFNIAEQIEYLSRRLTLLPGDIIATGTPAGVGRPRGIFLKPGDTVHLEIGGIGMMQNKIVQGD
jgi:2-keto-4-pentenoate hydratase/2-oxohepta-3-ene-1,7-dioic acid hydratase in catechol pathway